MKMTEVPELPNDDSLEVTQDATEPAAKCKCPFHHPHFDLSSSIRGAMQETSTSGLGTSAYSGPLQYFGSAVKPAHVPKDDDIPVPEEAEYSANLAANPYDHASYVRSCSSGFNNRDMMNFGGHQQATYWYPQNHFPNPWTIMNQAANYCQSIPEGFYAPPHGSYQQHQADEVTTSDMHQAAKTSSSPSNGSYVSDGGVSTTGLFVSHSDLAKVNLKKPRVTFSSHQVLMLEQEFKSQNYLCRPMRAKLAMQLGLSERQVKIWFQNRRMKAKKESNRGAYKKNMMVQA